VADDNDDNPPSVAPPMASLLRKARNRRRDLPYAEEGVSPQAYREDVRVPLEQEQFDAPPVSPRDSVAALLRRAREQRGQDLEAVARALRIRHPYLVAIEEARYKDLPGAPYASGFVRSYAEYVGLDADEMLRRFREESGGMGARTELVFPAPVSEGGFPAAILIGVVIILAAIVYGVWYFYQWRHGATAESVSVLPDRLAALIHAPGGEDRPDAGSAQAAPSPAPAATPGTTSSDTAATPAVTPAPATNATTTAQPAASTAKSAAPSAAATPTPAAPATAQQPAPATAARTAQTPPPAPATPAPAQTPAASTAAAAPATQPQPTETAKAEPETTPPPPTQQASGGSSAAPPPAPDLVSPSRVVLKASEDCWIEIRDPSGAIVASRLMHKGDAFPVPPRQGLTLTVGNAGALTVLLDGNPLPPLGKTGMVRHDVPLDPDRAGGTAAAANPAPAPAPANSDSPNN
jgi:cytoskeleton protein RodZ